MVVPANDSLLVEAPGNVILVFSITGSDVEREITWTFKNTTLTEATDSRYMFSDDLLTLTITGVEPRDGGVYTFTAINPAGTDSATVQLTVLGECTKTTCLRSDIFQCALNPHLKLVP